ncbi:hypothetical protein ACFL27_15505 [candidate division CSSED10-310 bacterium]|uniref:Type II secretion system protein GspC N-terminal domain-containing protein n=1 Tax=candidate division CSSED10-310 bacterium TaxID=2855610 RepID=A0ABV6YZU6_UNCC1
MFKNYLLINSLLGGILMLIIIIIVRNAQTPVEEIVTFPTMVSISTPSPSSDLIASETPTETSQMAAAYESIQQKNLFHPERIVPTEPEEDMEETPTPTPQDFDCAKTQITLSGIVSVENEKPYCFIRHPVATENQVAIFYPGQDVGEFTVAEISEDSIVVTTADGKRCEILLFNFSDTKTTKMDPRKPPRQDPRSQSQKQSQSKSQSNSRKPRVSQ